MSATKTRRRRKPKKTPEPLTKRPLRETFRLNEAAKVDGNVVRGVVLLGLESKNGRVYEAAAVQEAVKRGLYNTHIYVDHITEREEQERDGVRTFRDLIGVAQDTVFKEGKVIGDIHVLASDRMGAKFLEAASNPVFAEAIGMSHDAVGEVEERDGKQVVTQIHDIQSADAVTRPATTKSLYESENRGSRMTRVTESRVTFKSSADGEDREGTMVGEMVQVRTAEGEIVTVPKEMVNAIDEMEEEPEEAPESEETEEAEGEEPKEKEPMAAEKAQESARVKALQDENRKLKEGLALASTRDLVATKTAKMTPAMGEVVREAFKDRTATEKQIDDFIGTAKRIAEANAKDSEGEAPTSELSTRGWIPESTTSNSHDDGALIASAFGIETEV